MGTRGSIGLTFDGTTIHAYNHFDSYPTFLGGQVLDFVRAKLTYEPNREAVLKKVRALKLIDETEHPTPAQARSLARKGLSDVNVSDGNDWYSTLRNAQGNYQAYLDAGYWPNNTGFYRDYVFCEWSYVVDLDAGNVRIEKAGEVLARWAFDDIPSADEQEAELKRIESIGWGN